MTAVGNRAAGRPRNAALDGAILAAAERQLGELGYARDESQQLLHDGIVMATSSAGQNES